MKSSIDCNRPSQVHLLCSKAFWLTLVNEYVNKQKLSSNPIYVTLSSWCIPFTPTSFQTWQSWTSAYSTIFLRNYFFSVFISKDDRWIYFRSYIIKTPEVPLSKQNVGSRTDLQSKIDLDSWVSSNWKKSISQFSWYNNCKYTFHGNCSLAFGVWVSSVIIGDW